jgi:putative endonuclease
MEPRGWTCILASRRNGALYVGSTTGVSFRVYEHQEKLRPGFTSRYEVTMLVWYEAILASSRRITREYAIKKWRRTWTTR